ncbi:MAG: protein phosphatase 2C domain-containing protein [Gammaproteobacteria bacterium]
MPVIESPLLYAETDLDQVEAHSCIQGKVVVFTSRSPVKETVNEDVLALIPVGERAGVFVIADGLGGLPAGEVAARIAVASLKDSLQEVAADDAGLREAILNGIEQANASILALGSGCATTLAVVEVRSGVMRSYHVGDSLIMLVGQRGKMKFQNVFHSPVGYAVEAGMLDEVEAVHHEERNVVSNVIGTPDMRIDIGPTIELADRDTLLLASDGLPDNLYVDEIVARIKAGPLRKAGDALVRDCRERMLSTEQARPGHPDDLSVILFRLARD